MKSENIKKLLYKDFKKWFEIHHWNEDTMQEKHIKQYLGYFGVNRRGGTQ